VPIDRGDLGLQIDVGINPGEAQWAGAWEVTSAKYGFGRLREAIAVIRRLSPDGIRDVAHPDQILLRLGNPLDCSAVAG
jgi:hypothetical protein